MTQYETIIGLEFHAELKTKTKIFCSCPTSFAGEPNTRVCPVCLGLPGVLPVLNKAVVEMAVKAGLSLNCAISRYSKFDRKNYFYPDLPKAYQVTQYPLPICKDGWLQIEGENGPKKVRINRIHMEEDAGKLVHSGETIATSAYSLPDYNRAAVPLIEIVTEPDMASAEEAYAFAQQLKLTLEYAGVSDVKMEQGSLRCDVNISIRPVGQKELGVKREIKNLNSFSAMRRAIAYEEAAQAEMLENGERIIQETMTWDDNAGCTISMRSKEDAHDYRYFPEPDLVPVVVDQPWVDRLAAELPEMPPARFTRLTQELGLSDYDAGKLVSTPALGLYFDQVYAHHADAKTIANWLLGDVSRILNAMGAEGAEIESVPLPAEDLAALLDELKAGKINNNTAKTVLEEMFKTGEKPAKIIAEKGFSQISDTSALEAAVQEAIANNPKPVADYRAGKQQSIGFLVGQVMKATKGQANAPMVKELLEKALAE